MKRSYGYATRRQFSAIEEEGVNDKWHVRLNGVGKAIRNNHSYLIANEWISSSIASFLGLPAPPFAIMQKSDARTRMFVTIRFDQNSKQKNVNPEALWRANRWLTIGIITFDVLICNQDRHDSNIKVDKPEAPKQVHVFDHERAIFYCQNGRGRSWLTKNRGESSIGPFHCLPPVVTDIDLFPEWVQRVQDIPDWFFADVCKEVRGYGITNSDADAAVDFLRHRRDKISALILSSKSYFTQVPISKWPLFF